MVAMNATSERPARRSAVAALLVGVLVAGLMSAAPPARASRIVTLEVKPDADFCETSAMPVCAMAPAGEGYRVQVGRFSASEQQALAEEPCPPDAFEGAICGSVDVPLDRNDPQSETIAIHYELYRHTEPGPAESVIVPNFGGPGASTTFNRGNAMFILGANLATRDLLLIDDRGRGLSGAIDCVEEFAAGPIDFDVRLAAVEACAAKLGESAGYYTTGWIAEDYNEVISSLGYTDVDLYGLSYGGMNVVAFSARFPDLVRSVVLDGAVGPATMDRMQVLRWRAQNAVPMHARFCNESPTCSRAFRRPGSLLRQLVAAVREQPISGFTSLFGQRIPVTVDESMAFNLMMGVWANLGAGDLVGAAHAVLKRGDKAPLMRLAGEFQLVLGPPPPDADPTIFSEGAAHAAYCSDLDAPWDWSDPVAERVAAYQAAVAAIPTEDLAPFSTATFDSHVTDLIARVCAGWSRTSEPEPVVPQGSTFPDAPVLALAGALDNNVTPQETAATAELFPNSTFVEIGQAWHTPVFWQFVCAIPAVNGFIDTLEPDATTCTPPAYIFPANGRFPEMTVGAAQVAVKNAARDDSNRGDRKAAMVASHVVKDVATRGTQGGLVEGRCLRGGTYLVDFSDTIAADLTRCRVTGDLRLSGTVEWVPDFFGGDGIVRADVRVRGFRRGRLRISGPFQLPGADNRLTIRGRLGERRVVLRTPAS